MDEILRRRITECAKAAYTTMAGIYNTYEMAEYCIKNKIEGAFVETGVALGAQIGVMGIACQANNDLRRIWGFDSFQGIPMASEKDDVQPALPNMPVPTEVVKDRRSLLVSSGITSHSKASVESNLLNWGVDFASYRLIEGWFQDTLPVWEREIGKIALLRLDGDLYDSTIVALHYLYPKVEKGGVIIVDDYSLLGARRAVEEYLNPMTSDDGAIPIMHPVLLDGGLDYGAKYFIKP